MAKIDLGPRHLFMCNLLDDGGGDYTKLVYLGFTSGTVELEINQVIAEAMVDQFPALPYVDGIYHGGYAPVVKAPLVNVDETKLETFMLGSQKVPTKDAMTFNSQATHIDAGDILTLCMLPALQTYPNNEPFAHPYGVWFSGAYASNIAPMQYKQIAEGNPINAFEVSFKAVRREFWQDGTTAIPDGCKVWWKGSPTDVGITQFILPTMAEMIASIAE